MMTSDDLIKHIVPNIAQHSTVQRVRSKIDRPKRRQNFSTLVTFATQTYQRCHQLWSRRRVIQREGKRVTFTRLFWQTSTRVQCLGPAWSLPSRTLVVRYQTVSPAKWMGWRDRRAGKYPLHPHNYDKKTQMCTNTENNCSPPTKKISEAVLSLKKATMQSYTNSPCLVIRAIHMLQYGWRSNQHTSHKQKKTRTRLISRTCGDSEYVLPTGFLIQSVWFSPSTSRYYDIIS